VAIKQFFMPQEVTISCIMAFEHIANHLGNPTPRGHPKSTSIDVVFVIQQMLLGAAGWLLFFLACISFTVSLKRRWPNTLAIELQKATELAESAKSLASASALRYAEDIPGLPSC
jgi:hypothetical protein